MLTGLGLGALTGLGVWLVGRGLTPARRPLATDLAALAAPAGLAAGPPARRRDRSVAALVGRAGVDFSHLAADLAVCGRTVERHATERLGFAVFFAALPAVAWAAAGAVGVWLSPALVAVVAAAVGAAGWAFPAIELRSRARARRREFASALGVYLDLVAISLAGGAGVQTALRRAAEVADGWSFAEIRHTLAVARLTRTSPWDALGAMARRFALPELLELTSSLALAGTSGSRVRDSLVAKAQSFRAHDLAETERKAQAASEKMSAPVVLMLTGLLLLIGYPAVRALMSV